MRSSPRASTPAACPTASARAWRCSARGSAGSGSVRKDGASRVAFSSAGVETPGPLLPAKALDLRVEVADQAARYSYSLDGGKTFVALGAPAPLRFSWWKGARPALFTYDDPAQAPHRPSQASPTSTGSRSSP